ncbi:cation diffusion facilitator family transporter [Rhabdothermincola sp.]|uniref:cation diffusion facilitator family transporter n=1 Tax=Rhabdothermincola sp. TaxID=2820405 RepID=UPI002FE30CAB
MASSGGRKAILAALLANLGIAMAKFIGFLVTRASSMLAESIHSVADSGNQALLLLGGARARRPADDEHQFGYGRERYFWSFIVAQVLFVLGGVFSLYEGIEKLRHPHELESPMWAIGILLVAIVLETFSFRTAVVESRPAKGDASWVAFVRRSKSPELPVVLLEDLGALVGLVLALTAIVLAAITGNSLWDGLGTISIGALLLVIAVVLAIEMKSLLIGEAASDEDEQAIRSAIGAHPTVRHLISLRTQHLGPDELLVAVKVEFDGTLTMRELAEAIDAVEQDIRSAVPTAQRVFIEPDIRRAVAGASREIP